MSGSRVAIARVWVAGALYVVQDQLRWQLRPRAFAAVAVVTAVATTVATAVYVFPLNGGALGVVAAQVTGALVGLMTALALCQGSTGFGSTEQRPKRCSRMRSPGPLERRGLFERLRGPACNPARAVTLARRGVRGWLSDRNGDVIAARRNAGRDDPARGCAA